MSGAYQCDRCKKVMLKTNTKHESIVETIPEIIAHKLSKQPCRSDIRNLCDDCAAIELPDRIINYFFKG